VRGALLVEELADVLVDALLRRVQHLLRQAVLVEAHLLLRGNILYNNVIHYSI